MRRNITKMHNLKRTSPKGEKFIGVCLQCGREMSLDESMNSWCENVPGFSQEEALNIAIGGKKQ